MDPLLEILKKLNEAGVPFVLVGGMAAIAHGSPVVTQDVDVCAPLDHATAMRIIEALEGVNPRYRMRPDLPVVRPDNANLVGLKNLYLRTDFGQIDILGEVSGVGVYEQAKEASSMKDLGAVTCQVLNLDALISAKVAAGREKDRLALVYLNPLLEMQKRRLNP
ncbi:MAG TPA: hypothetical protein VFE58_03935 [Tepidisphaeraceae bacterium]|jgi:predicted nucleotidyltransferase|nr:hypothetical protein [Tepidisphaeraceae bacterium]